MRWLAIAALVVAAGIAHADDIEVRATAIVGMLMQQRDQAMNQAAACAVDLAKAKSEIDALHGPPKPEGKPP